MSAASPWWGTWAYGVGTVLHIFPRLEGTALCGERLTDRTMFLNDEQKFCRDCWSYRGDLNLPETPWLS